MKYHYLVLITLATCLEFSCSNQMLPDDGVPVAGKRPVMITKSSSDLVTSGAEYRPELGKWLLGQEDPFELGRYQNTFARAARALGKESSVRSRLSATHYALRISPSTFAQQESLEQDPDLDVSYIPFGYVLVNGPVPGRRAVSRSDEVDGAECSYGEEGPETEPTTLYVIWPVEKEIPASLTYEKEYDVFLPGAACLTEDEEDVTDLIRIYGDDVPARAYFDPFAPIPSAHLTIKVYDNFLEEYIPLKNVKVKANYGSNTMYLTTNSLGKVEVSPIYGHSAYCSYLLEQTKFSVRDSTTSAVVQRGLGTVTIGDLGNPLWDNTFYTYNLSEDLPEIVYNAADYLFKEDTLAAPDLVNIPAINIFIKPPHNGPNGEFHKNPNRIYIYENPDWPLNHVIGTTHHELGHYFQFYHWEYDDLNVEELLKGSFASCFGYFYGEEYYLSKGYVKPFSNYEINGQQRQNWQYNWTSGASQHSPLYVDLIDDHNQYVPGGYLPNDTISGVSFSIILRMGKEAESLEDVEDILNEEIVPPYSTSIISSQLWPYYQWRSIQL